MAEALKLFFDRARVERIATELADGAARLRPSHGFDRDGFVADASQGLGRLELLDRARHIAGALGRALPAGFPDAARLVAASLRPPLPTTESFGMEPFHYLPHVIWVADAGLGHVEAALDLQHALTQRMSCEFSIRAYLVRHPEVTLARLHRWAGDPDAHVRRLVSEGTRPRLPWAPRLPAFQRDPSPVLPLLERLKDDPSLYVRRSVANHLGDIAKDHPDRMLTLCEAWAKDAPESRRFVIRHAVRWLVKRGEPRALALALAMTTNGRPAASPGAATRIEAHGRVSPVRIAWAGRAQAQVTLRNRGRERAHLLVNLAVHYVKASGKSQAKVFRWRVLDLGPGARVDLARTLDFTERTTRKHHPGRHAIDVVVNGKSTPLGAVVLGPRPAVKARAARRSPTAGRGGRRSARGAGSARRRGS